MQVSKGFESVNFEAEEENDVDEEEEEDEEERGAYHKDDKIFEMLI